MSGAQLPATPHMAGDAFDDCSIAEYYTKKEMAEMSAYQIKTLKNMKRNFLMLHSLGLPVKKPNFMKTPAVKKRQLRVVESDSDSDEEWRPTSKTKNKTVRPFKIPVKFVDEHTDKVVKVEKKTSCGKKRKATPGTISDRSAPSYPKRNRPITNYMDIEVPDDDSFLYCEECNKEYPGDCPEHGPLDVIQDKEIKNLKQSMATAEASLPDCVVVKSSSIPNAGLGVFATCSIKSRTRFGPYKGVMIRDVDEAHSTGYAWQIYSDGKPGHYVDASDPKHSNWMRYVNCARSDMEQNLTAFQYKGEVYYRSHQDIAPGQELLVWYGADYGSELGIHKPVLLNKSQGGPYSTVSKTGEVTYGCGRCPYIQFVGEKYLLTHMKYKHWTILPPGWNSRQPDNVDPQNVKGETRKDQKVDWELLNQELEHVKLCHLNTSTNNGSRTKTRCVSDEGVKTDGKCEATDVNCNFVHVQLKIDTGFCQKSDLTSHIKTHTGVKPYQCTMCDARFSQKSHLTGHIRTHTGEKPYQCTMCDARFSEKGPLTAHIRTHTGEKPYQCTMCDARFSEKGPLTRHIRTHTGEKPYQCTMCDARFSQKSHLTGHIRTHTGEKPYQCTMCDARFSQKSHLTGHIRTHTGEKPYQCTMCDARFSEKGPLTRHIRTHTGEKPYQCTMCDARFCEKGHLKIHIRTHTGEKPYQCTMCDARFSMKCDLTKHIRTHTGEKPYQCTMCEYRCAARYSLTYHMVTRHGVTKTKGLGRPKAATTPPVTSCGSGAENDKQVVEKSIGLEE